jgi:predicted negative regulator of RcsB-dependent stress response
MRALIALTCLVILAGAGYLGWREFSGAQTASERAECLEFVDAIKAATAPGGNIEALPDAMAGARDCVTRGVISERDMG